MPVSLYVFLCFFLPCFFFVWKFIASLQREALSYVLLAFSLLLCALWNIWGTVLLAALMAVNYGLGLALSAPGGGDTSWRRRGLLAAGILLNCLPLAVFRYVPGFAGEAESFTLVSPFFPGLAFWMLMQIGWLWSIYRRQIETEGFLRHAVFSTAFPYLFAGPIVRYEQVCRQFDGLGMPSCQDVARAVCLIVLGLAKKVLFADTLGVYTSRIFDAAQNGLPLSTAEAWAGSLCFTFQVYFDFSGYTDIAIGAALLIGLRLPENFRSPYRATGFIEFWRRWHITLSNWLRDFPYMAIGGAWCGRTRQILSFACAIVLAGLWHGADVTFFVWAGLNGVFLLLNFIFRFFIKGRPAEALACSLPVRAVSSALTFVAVSLCWVVFRSESVGAALAMYRTLLGFPVVPGGVEAPAGLFANGYFVSCMSFVPLAAAAIVVFAFPTSREFTAGRQDGSRPWLSWAPTPLWAALLAALGFCCLVWSWTPAPFIF